MCVFFCSKIWLQCAIIILENKHFEMHTCLLNLRWRKYTRIYFSVRSLLTIAVVGNKVMVLEPKIKVIYKLCMNCKMYMFTAIKYHIDDNINYDDCNDDNDSNNDDYCGYNDYNDDNSQYPNFVETKVLFDHVCSLNKCTRVHCELTCVKFQNILFTTSFSGFFSLWSLWHTRKGFTLCKIFLEIFEITWRYELRQ